MGVTKTKLHLKNKVKMIIWIPILLHNLPYVISRSVKGQRHRLSYVKEGDFFCALDIIYVDFQQKISSNTSSRGMSQFLGILYTKM